ncbi:type II toxin-antitoxin system VapC family toxin [Nocardia veterana]|uniref:Type II toxin-antitoxin system VapC family toxin n=1 Tax=Nocardia veterana TaxID=132249 RepID=A0A7X6M359_9NOCA|nr:PIN domain-containing protein [Nocardia veterana]NKY89396.1 type II toxin-antitoxin system VapC family toxin [Nocardia veterana]
MRLLLDTHVALCWLTGDPALSDELVDTLAGEPDVFLSAVTIWEIAIKQSIGKLEGPADLPEQLRDPWCHKYDVDILPV